jgi:hypothetical protein
MAELSWWPWLTLAGLGAVHGVNPGMGWLFAVALGLQEGRARAVWRALPPLALGHAAAIAIAVAVAAVLGGLVPVEPLRWGVAGVLLVFGLRRLRSHRHPPYGGMRVGGRELTVWSFLMATAHGAGLMILPVVLGGDSPLMGAMAGSGMSGAEHAAPMGGAHVAGLPAGVATGLAVSVVHTLGYLTVAMLLAWLVYARFGVRVLRAAWINLDLVCAGALIATALVTPFL